MCGSHPVPITFSVIRSFSKMKLGSFIVIKGDSVMRQVGPFIMVGVALGPLIRFRFWP